MKRVLILLSVLSLFTFNLEIVEAGGGKAPAPPPLTISPSTKDVFYVNQNIKFTASGGTTPYRFTANIGSIDGNGNYKAPSSAGNASVKVTDKKGNTATYNVPVYFYLRISPTSSSVPTSSNYSFSGAGGLSPYRYSTTRGTVGVSNGVFSTPSTPGAAVITVTDSRNNKANSNVTVYQSLGITPTSNLIMVGKTFTFTGTGGYGSYSYSTTNGSIASNGVYTAPSSSGSATVTVTDSRGAKANASVTIYPSLAINPIAQTIVVGKSFTFTGSGGYGNRTFTTTNGSIGQTNGIFIAPPIAGSAIVTLKDSLNNSTTANVTINSDLTLFPTSLNVAINKTANFTGSGGISPRTFSSSYGGINSATGAYLAPSAGGLATITVSDSSGPKLTKTASVCVFAPLAIYPVEKTVVIGRSVSFSGSEGCQPYTYSVENNIGTINPSTGVYTAPTIPPATGTKATIKITDAAGNLANAYVTINPNLALEPPPLTLPINATYNLMPSGGVPPYNFSVTNGVGTINSSGKYFAPGNEGTANISVTDGEGVVRTGKICVYEPLQISPTQKSLVINSSLTFSASHGCEPYKFSTNNGSININSGSYTAPGGPGLAQVNVTDLANKSALANLAIYPQIILTPLLGKIQTGKTFKFTAKGGVPELVWESTIGDIITSPSVNPLSVEGITDITSIVTFSAPNTPGTAIIKVTDSMNFNQTASLEIYAPLAISPVEKTLVVGDKFSFSASGGVPIYTYESDMNNSFMFTVGNIGNFTAPGEAVIGKVTVRDSDGNEASAKVTVNPGLTISPTSANLEVNNSMTFVAEGGIGPYRFSSSMDARDIDENGNFRPIKSGIATITLRDSAGHEVSASVKVYDPLEIIPKDKVLAVGDSFDRFTAKGGIPNYGFSQSIGIVDPVSGIYTAPLGGPGTGYVEVTDSIGNKIKAQITINPALTLEPETANVEVGNPFKFSASGGIGDLTFSTDSGRGQIDSSGNYVAPPTSGPATITVVDKAGHSKSVTINIYDPLKISPEKKVLVLSESFQFNITGGVFPYKVKAITGGIDLLGYYTARLPGADTITVEDKIGKIVTATVTVNSNLDIKPKTANLEVNKVLPFEVTGGIGPFTFRSSMDVRDMDLNGNFRPIKSGKAIITVTDSTGISATAEVNVYDPLNISPTQKDLAVGNKVLFIITGGALPYKEIIADRGVIDSLGNYTAPSEVGNSKDLVTVIDTENNRVTASLNIKSSVRIDPPTATLAVNRTITFTANDGVGPYTFTVKDNVGQVGLTTGSYRAPGNPGVAEVTVKDSLGNTATAIVTINQELDINPKNINLAVSKPGSFTSTGGVGDRRFSALRGSIDPISGAYVAPSSIGEDTVTVTDGAGFTKIAKVNVYGTLKISPAQKELAVNDRFKFEITGGFPTLNVSAQRGTIDLNGNYIAPSEAGSGEDTITVSDSDNNRVSAKVFIYGALSITPETANLEISKKLDFTVSGGIGPYTYVTTIGTIASNKSIKNNIGYFSAPATKGTATITVTDNANHSVTATVNIYEPLKISPTNKLLALGNKFDFIASGGFGDYEFGFETKIGEIVTVGNKGSYTAPSDNAGTGVITLKDSIGNIVKATIAVNTSLAVRAPASLPVNGELDFKTITTGGIPDYSFDTNIGNFVNGNYKAPAAPGMAEIVVTDSDGVKKAVIVCIFSPLTITPDEKIMGVKDTQTFEAKEGCKPYRFEVAGGSFNFVEGAVSGLFTAPDQSGSATIKVIDSVGNDFTAKVDIKPALSISPSTANLEIKKSQTFTASGGVGDRKFKAQRGQIGEASGVYIAPDTAGEDTITVEDGAGHSDTAKVTVYNSLKITPNQKNLAVGDSIDFVIEGGFGQLNVVPVGGTIDENRKFIAATAGRGTVTVADSAGNTVEAILNISAALSLSPDLANLEVNKSLPFVAAGGVGTYRFMASTGARDIDTSGVYRPIKSGTATITVTDEANHSVTATVNVYDSLSISPEQKDLMVGNKSNFTIIGGLPILNVRAARGSIDNNGNYTAPSELGDGKDIITVTDSDNNTVTANISIKSALIIKPSPVSLAVNRTKKFEYEGGVGPNYTFTADNGTVSLISGDYMAPSNPGTAKVTVTDSMGNTATADVTINPELSIDPTNINLAVNKGTKFSASGGVGDLTFSIPSGGGSILQDGSYTAPGTKGLVQVTVTDSEGISKFANVNVYLPLKISPEEKILAVGNRFDFDAIEGVPPYVFSSDTSIGSIITNIVKGSFTAAGTSLPAVGFVTLKDSANPDNQVSAKVTVNAPLSIEPKPAFLAINGNYDFKASTKGGAPDYTYSADVGSFNNGIYTAPSSSGTALITVKDSMGGEATASLCIYAPLEFDPNEDKVLAVGNSFTFKAKEGCKPYKFAANIGSIGTDSGTFSSSITGSGQITVTDATNVNSAQIKVTINPALSLEPLLANLEVGKNKDFTASGGVFPYEFSLLTATGMGTINSGGSIVNYVAPLNGGSNTIRVTDSFGNTKDAVVTVYASLAISPSVKQDIEVGKPAITFTASGGVSPYSFILTNTIGTISSTGANASYNPGATKGVTKVILTDNENNKKEVDINVYASLILSPSSNQNIGKSDKLTFTASEGLPDPSGYSWSVSPSGANLVKSPDGLSAEFSAPNITELGTFFVTVTDSAGNSKSTTVGVFPPVTISPTSITLSVQGNATFTASGGTGSYVFSNTIGSIDQEGIFSAPNNPGTGTVTATDQILTNHSASANVTIIPKFMLVPAVASVEVGQTYSFLISGGVGPFQFSVDGTNRGSVSVSGSNLIYTASSTAGPAVIRGVDSLGNTTVANVTVYSGLGITPPSMNLAKNATGTFSATGGTPPYTWEKDHGTITPSGVNNVNGIYNFSEMVLTANVTVRDSAGKSATAIVTGDFPGTWIWASGVKEFNQGGKTGTGGYPGARGGSSNWADNNGNVYLQGGVGWGLNITSSSKTIILYYLWKYDTKNFTWTAIEQGPQYGNYGSWTNNNKNPPVAPQTSNNTSPGGRFGAATWTDASGNILWLFGGKGYGVSDSYQGGSDNYGHLNDLWRYEISAGEWTWVKGTPFNNKFGVYGTKGTAANGNYPGARVRSIKWRDLNGNLWLFGGYGYGASGGEGFLNDLWKFTPSTNSPYGQWTWVGGADTINTQGNYTSETANYPGGRDGGVAWMSSDGKLWLFGGNGLPNNSTAGLLNDLWKYDPSLNKWTFIKGRAPNQDGFYEINKAGSYGTKNVASANNLPGSRERAVGFTDSKGNLWLFGGYGNGNTIANGYLNDLWRINILSPNPQWVWERGSDVTGGAGNWGTIGVAADTNIPDARSAPVSWQDSNGLFWFFGGGQTRDEVGKGLNDVKYHNDLWKFFPE